MTLPDLEKRRLSSVLDHSSLIARPRRLRATPALRAMIRETELNARDFIYPLFVRHGTGRSEIRSMPGLYQLSIEEAVREAIKESQRVAAEKMQPMMGALGNLGF